LYFIINYNCIPPQGGGWEKIEASAQNKCGTK